MSVQMQIIEPSDGLPGRILARSADGLDAVEIVLRWDSRTGPAKAIALLSDTYTTASNRARDLQKEVRFYASRQ